MLRLLVTVSYDEISNMAFWEDDGVFDIVRYVIPLHPPASADNAVIKERFGTVKLVVSLEWPF